MALIFHRVVWQHMWQHMQGVVRPIITTLLQIYYRIYQSENLENRLRFNRIVAMSLMRSFLASACM